MAPICCKPAINPAQQTDQQAAALAARVPSPIFAAGELIRPILPFATHLFRPVPCHKGTCYSFSSRLCMRPPLTPVESHTCTHSHTHKWPQQSAPHQFTPPCHASSAHNQHASCSIPSVPFGVLPRASLQFVKFCTSTSPMHLHLPHNRCALAARAAISWYICPFLLISYASQNAASPSHGASSASLACIHFPLY